MDQTPTSNSQGHGRYHGPPYDNH